MRGVARGALAVALAASALLLAGCAVGTDDIPQGITATQRHEATQQELRVLWSTITDGGLNLAPPREAVVRYTTYLDSAATVAGCLQTSGYPKARATTALTVVDSSLAPRQEFPFEVAKYVCTAKYPTEPLELGYLSDAQEQYVYSYWNNETIPCLRARAVKVSDLPPVGQFGEGFEAVGEMNPYDHIRIPKGLSKQLLVTLCPPYPGELYGH